MKCAWEENLEKAELAAFSKIRKEESACVRSWKGLAGDRDSTVEQLLRAATVVVMCSIHLCRLLQL